MNWVKSFSLDSYGRYDVSSIKNITYHYFWENEYFFILQRFIKLIKSDIFLQGFIKLIKREKKLKRLKINF